jgi:predicted nucleic acid-binding protein
VKAFFDTNVIVYAHDRNADVKRNRARALIEAHVRSGDIVLSTQVLIESYNALQRAALLKREAALAVVEALADEHVVATDSDSVLRAIRLSQRHQLSHWDGLIVQAALDAGCAALYSEDMQAGMRFGDLEVVNPFADAAHEPRSAYASRGRAAPASPKPGKRAAPAGKGRRK